MPRMRAHLLSLVAAAAAAAGAPAVPLDPALFLRALSTADRLVSCAYNASSGTFGATEDLWQSGNTLESLAWLSVASGDGRYLPLLANSFARTPAIVDHCFDDHGHWMAAWARA